MFVLCVYFFFFKQKEADVLAISDWSSDVVSSDLSAIRRGRSAAFGTKSPAKPHKLAIQGWPSWMIIAPARRAARTTGGEPNPRTTRFAAASAPTNSQSPTSEPCCSRLRDLAPSPSPPAPKPTLTASATPTGVRSASPFSADQKTGG